MVLSSGNRRLTSAPMKSVMAQFTTRGMENTVTKLLIAVRLVERATLPRTRSVIRLAVGPPGQAANTMTPTANSGDRGKAIASPNPTTGSRINCATSPRSTALGSTKTR